MKNVFLVLVAFICFSFTTITKEIVAENNTTNELIIPYGCGPNASPISSSCWSGCVSVTPGLTGIPSIDLNNLGPRKPTDSEYQIAQSILDDLCSNMAVESENP